MKNPIDIFTQFRCGDCDYFFFHREATVDPRCTHCDSLNVGLWRGELAARWPQQKKATRKARKRVQRNQVLAEKHFERQVIDLCKLYRWRYYHTRRSDKSVPGFPDLVIVKPPQLFFVELKKDTEEPSPEQRDWLSDLIRCPGVRTEVWRPNNYHEITRLLRGK